MCGVIVHRATTIRPCGEMVQSQHGQRRNKELMTSRWQTSPFYAVAIELRFADTAIKSFQFSFYLWQLFCLRHLQSSMLLCKCGHVVNKFVTCLWTTTDAQTRRTGRIILHAHNALLLCLTWLLSCCHVWTADPSSGPAWAADWVQIHAYIAHTFKG